MKERCFLIPAYKKNPLIPDHLIKKLAGKTIIERAIDTALTCATGEDIFVLTNDEEISLICDRAKVKRLPLKNPVNPDLPKNILNTLSHDYTHCILIDPAFPLVSWADVEKAWKRYIHNNAPCLVSVRELRQNIWSPERNILTNLDASNEKKVLVESPGLIIQNLASLDKKFNNSIPFILNDHALEIRDYHDWWICEKILERRHVVFVVAGYPAIGMGHVYRALMLAHEINDHRITFVCSKESELAVEQVAMRDYQVVRQGEESLAETVIAQNPDLVINDFLNSSEEYIGSLQAFGAKCVNFEDEGPGAGLANLVINALYEAPTNYPNWRCGPDYFCLRDEFVNATRNQLRPEAKVLLISFGGTDQKNATLRVLNIVEPICRAKGISIRIVAGPGYAHKEILEKRLEELANPLVQFTWATNIMSRMMEGADLAICSAGRTVYELAHMRVPGIVLATHEREARHRFARPSHGFAYAGVMDKIGDDRIRNTFLAMLKQERRAKYWKKQDALNFNGNKARVTALIQAQLDKKEEA